MKLTFTLDDVLRDKTGQIGKAYKRYINPEIELESLEFNTNCYQEIFKFDSKQEYQKFLYEEYVFEIFAEANACKKQLDKKLNLWLIEQDHSDLPEKLDVALSNPFEFNASIGYTYFFISKMATRIRNAFFPSDSMEIWDRSDVVVTAEPKLLNSKPEGKIAIKIETSYNQQSPADYTYPGLEEFLSDKEIITKLMETYKG